jgi:hypothetical protein
MMKILTRAIGLGPEFDAFDMVVESLFNMLMVGSIFAVGAAVGSYFLRELFSGPKSKG